MSLLPKADLWLGDFNFRLGQVNHDERSTHPIRTSLVQRIASQSSLRWVKPVLDPLSKLSSRTDHVFCSDVIDCVVRVVHPFNEFNVISDHNALIVGLNIVYASELNVAGRSHTERLFIRQLEDPDYSSWFKIAFDQLVTNHNVANVFSGMTQYLKDNGHLLTRDSITVQLDWMNNWISWLMWESAERTLGSYVVNEVKAKKDSLLDHIGESQSGTDPIMLFKRSHRGKTTMFRPASTNSNVLEEATSMYSNVYHSISNPDTIVLELDIDWSRQFRSNDLLGKIQKYPSHKSCGNDGLHSILYKHLLQSINYFIVTNGSVQSLSPNGYNSFWMEQCQDNIDSKRQ